MTNQPPPLPDAEARRSILQDLDANLVVEAAAGTGKTTCLVGRLLNLFAAGAVNDGRALAAVTFTHKAASELRERLDRELDRRLHSPDVPVEERENLQRANAFLGDCHIGTIHSFCARLLRERPVEAGVDPDFSELEETEDLALRRRAWKDFAENLPRGKSRDIYQTFETFGLDLDTLGEGFLRFAEYPDIVDWPGSHENVSMEDVDRFLQGVAKMHQGLGRFRPALEELDPGRDQLLFLLQTLDKRVPRLRRPPNGGEVFRLAKLFPPDPQVVQKQWLPLGLSGAEAKDEHEAYRTFWREVVRPVRESCWATVYGAALRAFEEARDIYDGLRRENGVLNFQDLLMATAALLRSYPSVRADLAERYTRLLVDEVQDTDPIQAEIMFLLASADHRQRDWRRCRPRPGSLFIVGDPKQSIYRFRRADIVVYQDVKKLIVDGGGRLLELQTNFRSQPALLHWVNGTFSHLVDAVPSPEAVALSGRFAPEDSAYSPAYVPLRSGLAPAGDDCLHGVFYLQTKKPNRKEGISDRAILQDEADRIAAFIADAVRRGRPIPGRAGPTPAKPDDFLIITYGKSTARLYGDAVRRMGLPCEVSAGESLANIPALAILRGYLAALAAPDDPILLTAVLRGRLWGVSDVELYRWKKQGGSFSLLASRPDDSSPIGAILAGMERHWRLFTRMEPVRAMETILDDLGIWPLSCFAGDPALSAGAVATVVAELRKARSALPTLGALSERLSWLLESYEKEPLPAAERAGSAVRVMNLHKTKGLEAPVVFLASTRGRRERAATFAVRRDGDGARGGMALSAGEYGNILLACPADWEKMAGEEALFLAAERTRLNYVAATRAGAALVVSVHSSGKGWKSAFLPEFKPGVTIENALDEPISFAPPEQERTPGIDAESLGAATAFREKRRSESAAASWTLQRGKTGEGREETGDADERPDQSEAVGLGIIVHRLLDRGMADDTELRRLAEDALAAAGLPGDMADDLLAMTRRFYHSAVWRRVAASPSVHREIPYTLPIDGPDGPGVQRGVIDLAFLEDDGWVIVDYKSDILDEDMDTGAAALRHGEQLANYAMAWLAITGGEVRETGIFFLRTGEYERVPTEPFPSG